MDFKIKLNLIGFKQSYKGSFLKRLLIFNKKGLRNNNRSKNIKGRYNKSNMKL